MEKSEQRKRFPTLIVVTAAVFVSFLLSFFLGQSGVFRLRQLQQEYDQMQMQNYRLAIENKKVAAEIKKLRHDPAAIEKIAREELHYVSPGDVVLIVRDRPEKVRSRSKKIINLP